MKKILFTGGGSAGHVIPNLALIEEILSTGEADICYMGTDGIEKGLVAEWKLPYYQIECPKLVRGGGWRGAWKNLKIPAAFLHAKKQAEAGLRTFQPDLVFSKGGYVSLPVVFAAKKLKIPCLAHESDFSVGLANRIAAGKCEYLFTSFPETAEKLRRGKYTGAPLRRSVLSATKAEARKKFNIPFDANVILVFGGGSGSQILNEGLRRCLKTLTERYYVLHVCGRGNTVECNLKNYLQTEFVLDMGELYACADLVVSRAGAGTVFELLALKKTAILVPLEGATRGDQKQNAAYFEKQGLCRVLPQSRLSKLLEEIDGAFADEGLKDRLAVNRFQAGNDNILREIRNILKQ